MVLTYGSYLYKEIKLRDLGSFFNGNKCPQDNLRTLSDIMVEMNITKSTSAEVEMEQPGTVLHLAYLLQSNDAVDFGLCPLFKVWCNKEGWQYGCRFDKGKGRRIQVHCYGSRKSCNREEDYKRFVEVKENG